MSCSEGALGGVCPWAPVAGVAARKEETLASGVGDAKSPAEQAVGSASGPDPAYYSGSSTSAEPELVALGLEPVPAD